MRKKTKYEKKMFESDCSSSDVSANIYLSMLTSPAFMDLSNGQKVLYLYCKSQYYAEKKHPIPEMRESFTMNQSKWSGLFKLYKKNNASGFYRDMEALINHGFIICVECGANTRTKSIYAFSPNWQKYGTEDFHVDINNMTSSMQRKEREKLNNTE